MRFLSSEKLSEHKYKTPEGYLICTDAILARTGKQTYRKNEVFADSDDDSEIEVDRRPEDVFSDETLTSFENKPITVEHPDRDVNAENHNELSVGFVRDVRRATRDGQDVMIGNLVITDADTIEAIENGEHCELSCGYDCDIEDEANPVQKNIRGNHVALCERGRAGIARIVDSVKDSTAPSDLERIPYEARQEMKNANNKAATLTGICGQLQDIINRADDIEKAELKRKANKILNDLRAQFNIDASHLVVDTTKNVSEIKEYFRVWGYPSRSELQEVVNFYRLSKDEMKQVFGNHYDESDLNRLKYHDSIKDDYKWAVNDSLKRFEIHEGNNITLVRAKDLADAIKKVSK